MNDSPGLDQGVNGRDLDQRTQSQRPADQYISFTDLDELVMDFDLLDVSLNSEDQEWTISLKDFAIDTAADLTLDEHDADLDMETHPLDRRPPPEPDVGQPEPSPLMFTDVYFSATHNSYEGSPRRPVREQLESSMRAIEYDIHDNDLSREGYRLGHLRHGEAVSWGDGNPNTDALGPWLDVIENWSSEHLGHAPLLLTIALKDNLMDNRSYAEGTSRT